MMNKIELIKASAGSGKTFELMNRLAESIAGDGIDKTKTEPERLLATTFTVKAANELQERIRKKLLAENEPKLAGRVFDGLIGTVNGICGRLLSEYAIDAGLSPALDVLPEENSEVIFNAAVAKVFNNHSEKLEKLASLLSYSPLKSKTFGKTSDWKKDVKDVLDLARSNGLGKKELDKCAEESCDTLRHVFTSEIDFSLDDIKTLVKVFPHQMEGELGKGTEKTLEIFEEFRSFPNWYKASRIANAKPLKRDEFLQEIVDEVNNNLIRSKQLYDDVCNFIIGVFDCAGDSLEAYSEYKKRFGLVDFVDQECNVLTLAEENTHFGELLKQRLTQIMIDEFQDTSPIQLALFLKLNEFAKESLWVGDPKQAIYGFRGTDPELMAAVAKNISKSSTLPYSWRSKENLIELSNEIFTLAFSSMSSEDVELKIPTERKDEAVGGKIEAWHIKASKSEERMNALAQGVAQLIKEEKVKPGDIAVLFRSNPECTEFTAALRKWNITASASSGSLLDTPECQLVIAAYRYCIDKSDTVARATLLALYGQTPDWLKLLQKARADHLAQTEPELNRTDFLKNIRELSFLKKLQKNTDETPLEILNRVVILLNLDEKISLMPSPGRRMSNLDELRRLCCEYMKQALVTRSAATPAGFVATLSASDAPQAPGFGHDTVNVLTYHKSKGLEWPVVILGSLNSKERASAFSIRVKQAEHFEVSAPLKNRMIHYWPWPFGGTKMISTLDEMLEDNPLQKAAKTRECEEEKRLLYVGFTRARDRVIFALERKSPTKKELDKNPDTPDTLQHQWLDRLTKEPMFNFPTEEGEREGQIDNKLFPLTTRIFEPSNQIEALESSAVFTDELQEISGQPHFPARLSPSILLPTGNGTATVIQKWEQPEKPKCKSDEYDLLGNAFHNFIALNPQENQQPIAERILSNWRMSYALNPDVLIETTKKLYDWINQEYPESKVSNEVPISYRDENNTLLQGFIDMLIETPNGFIIVDHKTGIKDYNAFAQQYAPQLAIYRKAVEQATGRGVLKTILHLPLMGVCIEII